MSVKLHCIAVLYDFNFAVAAMVDSVQHLHCDICIRRKCTAVTDPPCAVISCVLFCGAVFHECKLSEHRKLCPLQKVACINVGNGCPMVMRRCDLRQHLAACPASVVCCTMEWCRWPMYSRERGTRVPFAPSSLRARCGQLDVALALRDQRMLDKAKRFPRRSLVRALRNSFTKRYPAVPLVVGGNPAFVGEDSKNAVGELSFSESDDEEKEASSRAPWLTAKEPPGLQRSILSELFCELPTKSAPSGCISDLTAEDVRCALCSKIEPECSLSASMSLTATSESVTEPLVHSNPDGEESSMVCSSRHHPELESLSSGCTSSSNANFTEWFLSSQATLDVPHCVNGISTDMQHKNCSSGDGYQPVDENNIVDNDRSVVMHSCTADADIKSDAVQSKTELGHQISNKSEDCGLLADAFSNGKSVKAGEEEMDQASSFMSVDGSLPCLEHSSESLPLTLHEVLAVDLNIEVCSRYTLRDPSLYSFICAQLFRRDEYMQHVQDVHSVIHDAIDHWLEVRCPLAHCGCTFSMHRRLPSGANIIFSPLLESLGLQRTDVAVSAMNKSTPEELEVQIEEPSSIVYTQVPTSEDTRQMGDVETESTTLTSSYVISSVAENMLKEAAEPSVSSPNGSKECIQEMSASGDINSSVHVSPQNSMEAENVHTDSLGLSCSDDKVSAIKQHRPNEMAKSVVAYENRLKEGTPEMFTSTEFDSAVCMRPRTSKEPTPIDDDEILCLTSLPFELLTRIATFLDSFSLCNLALTCWLLRDVCRGLLKQRGLVVQEWQRDGSRNPPHWKVSHQVSLSIFSLQFLFDL